METELIKSLDEVSRKGITIDVHAARMALNKFFNAKDEGCVVRVKASALRYEEMEAVQWAWVAEAHHGNKSMIQSLLDNDGKMITELRQMCADFQRRFIHPFGRSDESGCKMAFTSYLDGLLRLSAKEAEHCERPTTAFEKREVMASYTRGKPLGLDGHSCNLHACMQDLFGDLLTNVYCNWQENGRTPILPSSGGVAEKRSEQGVRINNFRFINLLNATFNILAKVLARNLVLSSAVWKRRHRYVSPRKDPFMTIWYIIDIRVES